MAQSDTIQRVSFPGGVADTEGRHACVRDRKGRLVAIYLESGQVLWRSAEAVRPLIIALEEVIALLPGPPAVCVALELTGANAGRQQWASEALPIPDWAEPGSADAARFWITAAVSGSSILLTWRAQARYRGGAAPSRQVLEQAKRDDAGSVAIDRATGKVTKLPAPARPEPPAAPEGGTAAPDVLEQSTLGARRYELVLDTGPQSARTVLRARDAASGALAWETVIDQGPARAPKALRP